MTQLTHQFNDALIYTCNLHHAQVRKADRTPYVAHLLSVAALVLEDGGTEDEAIAALLHDALEDQGGEATRQEILARFGPTVTAIVEGCTESMIRPKPPWRDRKLRYLANLHQGDAATIRVSLADKLHNGRSLLGQLRHQGLQVWQYFHQPPSETLWFYRELLQIYQQRSRSIHIQDFREVVTQLALEVPTSK